jgi:hypothetical protein
MPDKESRVRYRFAGESDCHAYPPTPAETGRVFREKRDEIKRSGRGGEAAIQERPVGGWSDVGETITIPAAGEGA